MGLEEFLQSAFYERLVQAHLQRKFCSVYYFRDRYEVDCVAGKLRVEVKIAKPHRAYPKDVLILGPKSLPFWQFYSFC